MNKFFILLFTVVLIPFSNCVYNEKHARSKLYPMAAAAYSNHPELCIRDTFNQDYEVKLLNGRDSLNFWA